MTQEENDENNNEKKNPDSKGNPVSYLMSIIREAMKVVPSVKYALGVVGIIAAFAIIKIFGFDLRAAMTGVVVMLALMFLLLAFSHYTTHGSDSLRRPLSMLAYFFAFLVMATLSLLFSSVFFRWPMDLSGVISETAGRKELVPSPDIKESPNPGLSISSPVPSPTMSVSPSATPRSTLTPIPQTPNTAGMLPKILPNPSMTLSPVPYDGVIDKVLSRS
jgi:hypothetical protein